MTNATKDLISNVDKLNEHFNVQLQHQKTAFFSDMYVEIVTLWSVMYQGP